MSSPVEFRHYMRQFRMEDLQNGTQPLRIVTAGPEGQQQRLFNPPTLQFRYKEKGDAGVFWTEWQDVPLVQEGADILAQMEVPEGLRAS